MVEEFDESVLKAMQELEGYTFEEAKVTYQQRKDLPATAFCGPNRTYPCHDPAHVRNAIVRLMTFKPKGWMAILGRVCARAKKMKVESSVCEKYGKATYHEESKIFKWYVERHKPECPECK